MKIVKPLEESELLIRGISETTENEAKKQKCEFIEVLLGTLTAKGIRKCISRKSSNKSRSKFLMPPHLSTNLEIQ